jgi:hypothetical protein
MGLIPYKNEEYLDWSDEENVEKMRAALKEVGDELGRSYPVIIGGKPVETDGEISSVNPANPRKWWGAREGPPSARRTWRWRRQRRPSRPGAGRLRRRARG